MTHAAHFLQRLDRLDDAQVAFAMSLYRNVPLVRQIVETAAPPGDGRVAIALAASEGGPHVLVERDGAFVTCLAAGMKHDLPVISKAAVDRAATANAEVRRALAALRSTDKASFQERIRHAHGPACSREDARELLAFSPLLSNEFAASLSKAFVEFFETWPSVARKEQLKILRDGRAARTLRRDAWTIANLAAPSLPMFRAAYEQRWEGAVAPDFVAYAGFNVHHPAAALRAAWAPADASDLTFEPASRVFAACEDENRFLPAAFVLAVAALRRPDLRPATESLFAQDLPFGRIGPNSAEIVGHLRSVLASPGDALERHLARGTAWLRARAVAPDGLDATTLLAALLYGDGVLDSLDSWRDLADLVPFAAASTWEDLFLPEAVLRRLPPVDPETAALAFTDALRHGAADDPPAAPDAKVGRNDPCHCGSGRKFKKCHGA